MSQMTPRLLQVPADEWERLKSADTLLRSILQNSPFLISTKDLNGAVTLANAQFSVLDLPPLDQFVGKSVFDLFPPDVAQALWANDQRAAQENRAIEAEELVTHKDGSLHTYFTVKFPVHDDAGSLTGTCALSVDITETKRAVQDSLTDALTGVENRRSLYRRFPIEAQRALRHAEWLNFALIDIDYFKAYNDHCGHDAGDDVLCKVATVLQQTLARAGDTVFRVGGEEFVGLFITADEAGARQLAEMMRQAVSDLQIAHPGIGEGRGLTVSIGLASLAPGSGCDFGPLYRLADAALYRAKAEGRNRVACAVCEQPDQG